VLAEAAHRGYQFDATRIGRAARVALIPVAQGQLEFELRHLREKLRKRDAEWLKQLRTKPQLVAHPLFIVSPGGIEPWERAS
jgi:hypothetical protein